ncbi:hypothetical protein [Rhizobium sp. AAP43]|uniref:hypothetical protein n=1 Tax=Rhizobium sp. AAP43 TaxID=1523420 RepID=UPI0006BA076A|nr:hypothetical protein [Rhizobium sp. AAP43]KPF47097.1 hypothetical protein IP76_02030 [Rhizobium sp. AAP43]
MTVIGRDRYSENMLEKRRYKASKCPQCKARTLDEAEKLCSATQGIDGDYHCAGDDESSLNPFGVKWDTSGRACELVAADARAEAKALDDWCMSEMAKMEADNPSPQPREAPSP